MNAAHLHLILVHIPVLFVPLGAFILFLGYWYRNPSVQKVALSILAFTTPAIIAAYLLGEGAEEAVESISGIVESTIETHEEAATVSLWLTIVVGLMSAAHFFLSRARPAVVRALTVITILLSVISSGALAFTAQQGGKIRHPEAFDNAVVHNDE